MATRPLPVLRDLAAVRMRASSAFALHALADLGPEHALLAAGLGEDPSTYGVLLPCDPERHVAKAVDHRAAGLLRSLAAPATVPGDGDRGGLDAALAGLVLDGALEMETGAGFVGGPAAHALFLGDGPAAPPPDGAIAALSRRGLEHAQALPDSDAGPLSA